MKFSLPDLPHNVRLSHIWVVLLELWKLGCEVMDPGCGWLLWDLLHNGGGFQSAGGQGNLSEAGHEGGGHP